MNIKSSKIKITANFEKFLENLEIILDANDPNQISHLDFDLTKENIRNLYDSIVEYQNLKSANVQNEFSAPIYNNISENEKQLQNVSMPEMEEIKTANENIEIPEPVQEPVNSIAENEQIIDLNENIIKDNEPLNLEINQIEEFKSEEEKIPEMENSPEIENIPEEQSLADDEITPEANANEDVFVTNNTEIPKETVEINPEPIETPNKVIQEVKPEIIDPVSSNIEKPKSSNPEFEEGTLFSLTELDEKEKPQIISDKFTNNNLSIYDRYQSNNEDISLGKKLQNQPLSDLRKAIGINDRFSFINELFDGKKDEFDNFLNRVTDISELTKLEQLIDETSSSKNWSSKSSFSKFTSILSRYIQSK